MAARDRSETPEGEKLAHGHTMLYALESKEHRVDTHKALEVQNARESSKTTPD